MEDQTLKDVLEIVCYLKDNMVSNADLDRKLESVSADLDRKLSETKNEIMNHVDGFIALHHKLDIEFTSLRAKCSRLEDQIQKVMKHINYQPSL